MSSVQRGLGSGARCGSERWARVNTFLSWPGLSRPSRLGTQCRAYMIGITGSHRFRRGPGHDNYAFPINIPKMNTSVPPTTTWNAACRKGESMYFMRIQEIAASSTATTKMATAVATQKSGMR